MAQYKNQFTLEGVIESISPVQNITDRFSKKTLILDTTTNEKWPKKVAIDFVNKAMDRLNGKRPGVRAAVDCEVDSRASRDGSRWFTSVHGLFVNELIGGGQTGTSKSAPAPAPAPAPDFGDTVSDDMPF